MPNVETMKLLRKMACPREEFVQCLCSDSSAAEETLRDRESWGSRETVDHILVQYKIKVLPKTLSS